MSLNKKLRKSGAKLRKYLKQVFNAYRFTNQATKRPAERLNN
jgi:hypothetical protein